MGCTSPTIKPQRKKLVRCDIEPADTEALKNTSLPILDFYVLLSNIKIKNCETNWLALNFNISEVEEYNCPLKEVDKQKTVTWIVNHAFDFMMTEYQLRKKFLIIQAVDKHKEVIGTLKINLYTIWIGPFHLDFSLDIKDYNSCRINFNFRISQGIHLKLKNTETQFIPHQPKYEGTRLCFTMLLRISEKTEPSNYSYHLLIQEKDEIDKRYQNIQTKSTRKDCIKWNDQPGLLQLPQFIEKIAYYELYASSIHFIFWKGLPGLADQSELRYESEGQCFLPISKLMSQDFDITKDIASGISYLTRETQVQEKVWLKGKEIGQAKVKLLFQVQTHQKQMQSCVRTEQGIKTSTPLFSDPVTSQKCEEINALKNLNISVQQQFISLDQVGEQNHNRAYNAAKQSIRTISNLFQKQIAILEKSCKESILIYNYIDEKELMRAQLFLIDLGHQLIEYAHEDFADLNDTCWQVLIALLKRGEFKLEFMGFDKKQKEAIALGEIDSELKMKVEVGIKYTELLNSLLKQTLRLLAVKGETAEQRFAEKFCAYAYFRMPLFREHIIECLRDVEALELPEWRGMEVDLHENSSSRDLGKKDDFYEHFFDWEHNFYKPLVSDSNYKQNKSSLKTLLLEDRWKLRLAQRKGAFFTFLENLIGEIQYVSVGSKHIRWHYLPGYNRLILAFLTEMKNTRIKNYTERFKRCSYQLLSNQKLLNVMIMLLLKRSDVNDPQTVAIAFEMIDEFFKAIKSKQRSIIGTFDYKYLLMGIKIVFESEFEMSISQVLLFIYDNFRSFSQQFSLQLSIYLMTRLFYRFFFHWSFNLRSIFHMLVLAKISRFDLVRQLNLTTTNSFRKIPPAESSYISGLKLALRQRYQSLFDIIKEEIQPQALSKNIDSIYEKELYKKMKSKIGKVKGQRHSSAKLEPTSMKYFPSTKSMDEKVQYVSPKKLLYFAEEDLRLSEITPDQINYVRLALSEYKEIQLQLKKAFELDPVYVPELNVKKLHDEAELTFDEGEQW